MQQGLDQLKNENTLNIESLCDQISSLKTFKISRKTSMPLSTDNCPPKGAQSSESDGKVFENIQSRSFITGVSDQFEDHLQQQIRLIQKAVAKYYGLCLTDLKGTTRTGKIALAKHIAMYLIREKTSIGYRDIGSYFGGKDHTTVLYACRKIETGVKKDRNLELATTSILASIPSLQ